MYLETCLALFIAVSLVGCSTGSLSPRQMYSSPTFSDAGHVMAVIEIPAGTNKKTEYDPAVGQFVIDQRDGKDRVINFLPYPGNYGYIPSTEMSKEAGGDGDALDILVLSESVPTGTIMEVIPIAALMLIDEGEQDTKIIGVPADEALRVLDATTFIEFSAGYPTARNILEDWMTSYDGVGTTINRGWKDERAALEIIKRSARIKQ